jgi:hypothetical protein
LTYLGGGSGPHNALNKYTLGDLYITPHWCRNLSTVLLLLLSPGGIRPGRPFNLLHHAFSVHKHPCASAYRHAHELLNLTQSLPTHFNTHAKPKRSAPKSWPNHGGAISGHPDNAQSTCPTQNAWRCLVRQGAPCNCTFFCVFATIMFNAYIIIFLAWFLLPAY